MASIYGLAHMEVPPTRNRILDKKNVYTADTQDTGEAQTLLIDSDKILFRDSFHTSSNNYVNSKIAAYLKQGKASNGTSLFSEAELAALASTNLQAKTAYAANGYQFSDAALSDNKAFLLSAQEAQSLYANNPAREKTGSDSVWWLRSAYANFSNNAGDVSSNGRVDNNNVNYARGVAPASNINLESLIFTSASEASKSSSLTKVESLNAYEFKATIKDASKTISTTGTVTRSGNTVRVPYAYSGENIDQISIVFTTGDITAPNTTVLAYGKLAPAGNASGSGTATFTMPNFNQNYKAYILAEDINDWQYTDYVSAPAEIAIPFSTDDIAFDIDFDTKGGSAVASQVVEQGNKVTKPADPTRAGYTFDGWYTTKEYTTAYNFANAPTDDTTIHAKWVKEIEKTTPITDYADTASVAGLESDQVQHNKQAADDAGYHQSYKAAEWTDKYKGEACITISLNTGDYKELAQHPYAVTKDPNKANLQTLIDYYGAIDIIKTDCFGAYILEGVTNPDDYDTIATYGTKVSNYNDYFNNHEPAAIYNLSNSEYAAKGLQLSGSALPTKAVSIQDVRKLKI